MPEESSGQREISRKPLEILKIGQEFPLFTERSVIEQRKPRNPSLTTDYAFEVEGLPTLPTTVFLGDNLGGFADEAIEPLNAENLSIDSNFYDLKKRFEQKYGSSARRGISLNKPYFRLDIELPDTQQFEFLHTYSDGGTGLSPEAEEIIDRMRFIAKFPRGQFIARSFPKISRNFDKQIVSFELFYPVDGPPLPHGNVYFKGSVYHFFNGVKISLPYDREKLSGLTGKVLLLPTNDIRPEQFINLDH